MVSTFGITTAVTLGLDPRVGDSVVGAAIVVSTPYIGARQSFRTTPGPRVKPEG